MRRLLDDHRPDVVVHLAAVVGGIGTIGVTGLWAWMFPALRKADRLD